MEKLWLKLFLDFFFFHVARFKVFIEFSTIFLLCYVLAFNGTPLQYSCLENPMGRGAW